MRTLNWTAAAVLLASAAFAQATIVTKEATGEAAIVDKNEEKAFSDAREQALRAAVEQAAGVRIDADTVTVNNQLVRDQIFANTSGYVKSYDVVSKKKEKGVVSVTVKAQVITEHLDKDITAARDLIKRMGRPSIVIMVQEQTLPAGGGAVFNSNTIASVLTEAFKADGWDVKDPAFAAGKIRIAPGVTIAQGEVKEIGDLSKADFMLYGSANFHQHSFAREDAQARVIASAEIYPVSGEYELSLFATKTGAQVAQVNDALKWDKTAPTPVISYERTAQDLVKRKKAGVFGAVRRGVLEYLRDASMNGTEIVVSVMGLGSYKQARELESSFMAVTGMKQAKHKSYAGGKATYQVTFRGSTHDLADAMESSTFRKKKLAVTAVTDTSLDLDVGR